MTNGFVAHDGLRPVLTVDFNEVQDGRLWADRGYWVLPQRQPVILDDKDSVRCQGRVVGPAVDHEGNATDEYVIVEILPNTWSNHEPS